MRSDLGSPALAKVREAVMGPNGNNLDDLVRLDGITLKPLISMDFHISAFLHTGDLEAVNALLLACSCRFHTYDPLTFLTGSRPGIETEWGGGSSG